MFLVLSMNVVLLSSLVDVYKEASKFYCRIRCFYNKWSIWFCLAFLSRVCGGREGAIAVLILVFRRLKCSEAELYCCFRTLRSL